jgi:hypothetical protein
VSSFQSNPRRCSGGILMHLIVHHNYLQILPERDKMTRPAQSKTVLFQAPLVINPTNNRLLRILQQTDNNIQDQI